MQMKKIIAALTVSAMLLSGLGTGVYADSGATAAVPAFTVTLNGQVVDNSYRQYPLLVYKDITYFPMTYYDCRFLGIESTWKGSGEGLYITATGVSGAYDAYKGTAKNKRSYRVSIPTFPITVNGVKVDNSKEEYPLLVFRDVTYFPMTWKWGVDNFNWAYSFNPESGLKISSNASHVSQSAVLPNVETEILEDGTNTDAACYAAGYVYWRTTDGKIMQAPLSNVSSAKKIFQLPVWDEMPSKPLVYSHIVNVDGSAQLRYHTGAGVMGSDHRLNLQKDGKLCKIQGSYWVTEQIGNKLFAYWGSGDADPGELIVGTVPDALTESELEAVTGKNPSISEFEEIGSEDYYYSGLSESGKQFALYGDKLYLSTAKFYLKDGTMAKEGFYLSYVDLKTGKTTVAASEPCGEYCTAVAAGDYIYYMSGADCYRYDTNAEKDELIGTMSAVKDAYYLGVAGSSVYAAASKGALYKLGESQPVNKGAKVDGMKQTGEYLVCSFAETASSQYRLMVFDESGACVFKTADKANINTVSVENGTLYYYNYNFKTICSVPL